MCVGGVAGRPSVLPLPGEYAGLPPEWTKMEIKLKISHAYVHPHRVKFCTSRGFIYDIYSS